MNAVRKIIENPTNPLTIELPKDYENKKVEVIVMKLDETVNGTGKYDFSDIAGKLEWKGDALAQQKKLRDEWQ
ncbi:MAG: hypothetical protein K2X48_15620 [Chitinophagaceae bacterium]|nr:hypothetical protein [Chitinophagaceae bacterium]